ncbi:MAG: hypothetical protein ACO3A4_10070 [Silvanigrellaceae bacterium]
MGNIHRCHLVGSVFSVLAVICLGGCGETKSSFTNIERLAPRKDTVSVSSASDANAKKPPAADNTFANAAEKFETGAMSFTSQVYDNPPNDFVFVVDNSKSMVSQINKFVAGFDSIPANMYPANTRLAVMNTMIGKLKTPSVPAEAVYIENDLSLTSAERSSFIDVFASEPGFHKFINYSRVSDHKAKVSAFQAGWKYAEYTGKDIPHFPLAVCESEWFLPSAKNATGQSCLKAAMQISGELGIEAGLTAIMQLVAQNSNSSLFRKNSFVHFVFLSDTHDPGIDDEELVKARPDFVNIEDAVRKNSPVVAVKLHGVVPKKACVSAEATHDFSYLPRIDASGGVAVDSCDNSVNYSAVVTKIFNEGKKHPPFKLGVKLAKDVKVKVDGKPWKDFNVISGQSVELSGLDLTVAHKIDVEFLVPGK